MSACQNIYSKKEIFAASKYPSVLVHRALGSHPFPSKSSHSCLSNTSFVNRPLLPDVAVRFISSSSKRLHFTWIIIHDNNYLNYKGVALYWPFCNVPFPFMPANDESVSCSMLSVSRDDRKAARDERRVEQDNESD